MKRFIISILLLAVFLIPKYVFAQTQALDLINTLNEEKIEIMFDDYSENDNQVVVYLFRGAGCTHCYDFLQFLNAFAQDNGNLFKLRSFEVYDNQDNLALKKKIAEYFGDRAGGVPYIIIGNKTFYGFSDDDGEKIETAIKEEYNNSERFDVFKELNKVSNETATTTKNVKKTNHKPSILTIIVFIIALLLIVMMILSNILFKNKKGSDNKSK